MWGCLWDPHPIKSCSLGNVSTATERRAPRANVRSQAALCCPLGSGSVYFQRGRLIRASSCQRFVSVPLLFPKLPLPVGSQELRQMNTFKSNSTPTDNSPAALPPAPLGRGMVVLCLISTTPGAQYRVWPRLRMQRHRSSHCPLEITCTLQSCEGEE